MKTLKIDKSFNITILNIKSNKKFPLIIIHFSLEIFGVLFALYWGEVCRVLNWGLKTSFSSQTDFIKKKKRKIKAKVKPNRSYTLMYLPPLTFRKFLFHKHGSNKICWKQTSEISLTLTFDIHWLPFLKSISSFNIIHKYPYCQV